MHHGAVVAAALPSVVERIAGVAPSTVAINPLSQRRESFHGHRL